MATRDIYTLAGTEFANSFLTRADGDARYASIGSASVNWGGISGTLANQTDLKAALDNLQSQITASGGSGTWGSISGTLSNQTDLQAALTALQPVIPNGTTAQYYRGDKTFQTLDKAAVGLLNVDNTSDANKPISTATQTALNAKQPLDTQLTDLATLTYSTNGLKFLRVNSGETGFELATLDKSTIGLANVDNTSDAAKPISTATSTALAGKASTATFTSGAAGLVPASGGGSTNYLRADGSWVAPPGGGGGSGTVTTVSVTTANGVSGSVANAGTTPAISLTLGAITPTSVAATGTVTGSNLSGTNTGDQTKASLGLGNVDNTSDANKPVSTAQQTALDAKQPLDTQLTDIAALSYSANGLKFLRVNSGATAFELATLDKTVIGLGNVDNTSDANKPVSTAQSTALGLKANLSGGNAFTGNQTITGGNITASNLSGTNTGDQTITLTGNVTGSGTGSFATTIATNAVTDAMLAQVATGSFKGRSTGGSGNVETLTATQATAMLDSFTSALKGLVPASGGGSTNYLRADGTWAAPTPTWGSITGTLSSQTDLNTALGLKAPLASPTFTGTVKVPTPANTADSLSAVNLATIDLRAAAPSFGMTTGGQTYIDGYTATHDIRLTGELTGTATLNLCESTATTTAAYPSRGYFIYNNTTAPGGGTYPITVRACSTSPGATVTILGGASMFVRTSTTNVYEVPAPGIDTSVLTNKMAYTGTAYQLITGTGTDATQLALKTNNGPILNLSASDTSYYPTITFYSANGGLAGNNYAMGNDSGAGTDFTFWGSGGNYNFTRPLKQNGSQVYHAGNLATFTSSTGGLVPNPSSSSGRYLKDDGTWSTVSATVTSLAWGNLTGTLSSQTDLQTALNLKATLDSPTFTGTVNAPSNVWTTTDSSSTEVATRSYVHGAIGSISHGITGGTSALGVTKTGHAVIILSGTLTSNATVYFGEDYAYFNRNYVVVNNTTGAYTVTLSPCSTGALSTVAISQGATRLIRTYSTNIYDFTPAGGAGVSDGDKGDITVSASGATWTIDANSVSLAKMAQVATATFLGRTTASTGNVEALTVTQATAMLNSFTTALKGLVPASGGGTTNFLRADGTWAAPSGGSGTVTSVSVVTANSLSGSVATSTSTPAITLDIAVATTSAKGAMSSTDKTKLDGIATAATANSSDATLLARANHTGTQAVTTTTFTTTGRLAGRVTAGSGATEELTAAQAKTLLAISKADVSGLINGFGVSMAGKPAATQRMLTTAPYSTTITSGASSGTALVAATAETVFTLKKGSLASPTTIGTWTFAAAGTTATVSISAGSITAGDAVWLECPASADATLADISLLIKA